VKHHTESFVFVANPSSVERQQSRSDGDNAKAALEAKKKKEDREWVARILEVRASDEHHVYARVYWMYWPDEFWLGTTVDGKPITGRQPYHGQHELVASNHSELGIFNTPCAATVQEAN
jgi:hypothetical protein